MHPHDYISPHATIHVPGDTSLTVSRDEGARRKIEFKFELPVASAALLGSHHRFRIVADEVTE